MMNYDLQNFTYLPKNIIDFRIPPCRNIPISLHIRTNKRFFIRQTSSYIYIGRPNSKKRVDINLENLPHSKIVSHIHARLKRGIGIGTCFIEDLASKNGTYVNHCLLAPYKPYYLEPGDLVSFGGDDMLFVFQLVSSPLSL